jgi:hypothetical protein
MPPPSPIGKLCRSNTGLCWASADALAHREAAAAKAAEIEITSWFVRKTGFPPQGMQFAEIGETTVTATLLYYFAGIDLSNGITRVQIRQKIH